MTPSDSPAANAAVYSSSMPHYLVVRTKRRVPLTGTVSKSPWEKARVLNIDNYPWHTRGLRQSTVLRMLYDDQALYLQFRCRDAHSFSTTTQTNGPVWLDSCVELFATIHPEVRTDYFNLEMNCCGALLMGYGPGRNDRKLINPKLASRIEIATSLAGPTKDESSADKGWWLAAALPFDVIAQHASVKVAPASGTIWRANAFRCGGKTDDQYACWSPIQTKNPDYHRPEFFGQLRFE